MEVVFGAGFVVVCVGCGGVFLCFGGFGKLGNTIYW